MSVLELLAQIRASGGRISVDGERLRVRGPKGMVTPELRERLARHKAELLEILAPDRVGEGAFGPAPTPVSRAGTLPLSFAQQRLWFLQQLIPENTSYNVPLAYRLEGVLDVGALEQALTQLVERHEVLRTTFPETDGTPFQNIEPARPWKLAISEAESEFDESPFAAAERAVANDIRRPFALAREGPLRVRLWRLGPQDHVLLVVVHHVAMDAWSVDLFQRELGTLYDGCLRGEQVDLAALSIQYADYAHWQRSWLRGKAADDLLAYWSSALEGVAPLDLPLDRTRPAHQTFAGAAERTTVDVHPLHALEDLGRQTGCSLFMTLLTAFVVLLRRVTRQDDIAVGTPAIQRGRPEFEGLIGCFLNMLVLRTDSSGDPTFRELLERVRDVTLGALEHQAMPFERLVEVLEPERDPSRNPLFQVYFTVSNATTGSLEFSGLEVTRLDLETRRTNFDLSVQVTPGEGGLEIAFAYNTALFDATTVRTLIDAYRVLLEALVREPDAHLAEFALLSDLDRERVLSEGLGRSVPESTGRELLHGLIARQAEETPDAIAAGFDGEQLTYRELDERAGRLALALGRRGVGRGVLVGLCVERGLDMLVGTLGILRAGGAYVPLDPALPEDRLRFMLEDTEAPVLVTQEPLRARFPEYGGEFFLLDMPTDDAGPKVLPPAGDVTPDDLAYVIFTSGSTGTPKGVQVRHGGVVNFLRSMAHEPGLGADDVLLAVTTLSFDIAVLELFLPLSVGARVEIASRRVAADGELLQKALAERGITVMQATPATWQMLLHSGWEGDGKLKMLCGGEELPRPLAGSLITRGDELWNLYGPTETTVWSAVSRVEPGSSDEAVSIGKPIAETQLLVLDERLQPVPQGVPGELHIGGAGLARGYLNRPELTAERFIESPWPDRIPGRLYKTGDLVRYDGRGRLRFLGRMDHQVKLRGFRIELGEIESALARHPGIRQAVAIIREDTPGDRRLVAYVTAHGGQVPTDAELREFLRTRLPDYMLPGAVVTLDALPLSPAGKVDRRRLSDLEAPRDDDPTERTAPRGPMEEAVADAFRELLGRESVGAHDDFFVLGGHSLLATQLVSRLRRTLQVELPLSAVFDAPTVTGLAEQIARQRGGDGRAPLEPIRPVSRDGDVPLSFSQRRLWFLDQVGTGAAYHMQLLLGLTGRLDRSVLEQALEDLVARHEVLRTRYVAVDGMPVQVVDPPPPQPLPTVDRSEVARDARDDAVQELISRDADRPFDLEHGPVIRATLVRLDSEEHALIITIHHIVADGWSIGLLSNEIAAHYRARLTGDAHGLPALPVQYADFAAWQRATMTAEVLDEHLTYWKHRLGGDLPVLDLPADRPRPAMQTFHGASRRFVVDETVVDALRQLSQANGVTIATVALAAFNVLLARLTRQDDILVGSPVAGRTQAEIEHLIGLFVNSVVLRTDLSGDPPFTELLQRVHDTALAAYDHQDLPFETLVEELEPERDPSRSPLFQVVFAMQYGTPALAKVPGLEIGPRPFEVTSTRHDLELYLSDRSSGFTGILVYNSDLFDAATVDRIAEHFQTLLSGIVADPAARLSELPLLTAEERQVLLTEWNATEKEDLDHGCIHQRVAARAGETPDAVALVYGDESVTYRELNERANQIGHSLRERGIGRGDLVGLCAERSAEMVVGLLGILKAGAAYVPLDPAYPRDRLAFMLSDSGVPVLLTQERLLGDLPEHDARTICLDRDGPDLARSPVTDPDCETSLDDLAYAIYTSGSTGKPKAALLTHRGLCNVSSEQTRAFGVRPGMRVLQFSSLSFDAATFEIVMALPKGATLCLGDRGELLPGPDLIEFIRRHEIEIVTLPPTALAACPNADLPSLRVITVAGEACPAELVATWAPGRRFFNLYGPTEATIWSTIAELEAGDASHIGHPIGNTQIHLLDDHGHLVPLGVPGELHIGGVGLARAYHGRPELTAERFVPNPFEPGRRLYKSGDLARRRADGSLEFLGRIDHQVKLRGHRIELGEIEAVLDQHVAVRQSIALVREDLPGDRRLIAYVVHAADEASAADTDVQREREQVEQWQSLYEQSYGDAPTPEERTFNIASWDSSYTGEAIDPGEMRVWLDRTVASILATGPDRVLEIGCGTGLLLFRIAPRCREYLGVDFSQAALDYVAAQIPEVGLEQRVRLARRSADALDGIPEQHFDTVILNSVVQYFPSPEYLLRVIENATRLLQPGGRIFVGDVRSLPLIRAFHASVQLHRAGDDLDMDQLRQRIHQHLNQDRELLIDPEFFLAVTQHLPVIRSLSIEPKPGGYDNELSRFCYDVILNLADEPAPTAGPRRLDWNRSALSLERTREMLRNEAPECVIVEGVPNRRTSRDARAVELLAGDDRPVSLARFRQALDETSVTSGALDPDDFRDLCGELPYACSVSWAAARSDGSFDVRFDRHTDGAKRRLPTEAPRALPRRRPWSDYGNQPLRNRLLAELVPQLREHVARALPAFMVPSAFVVLDEFPVTPNGKIDRRALPAPDSYRLELADAYQAPRTRAEELLAEVWKQTLSVERVGIHDNYFELGGDSIQSIQIVAAARRLGLQFKAQDLFQHQTVAELAAIVRTTGHLEAEQGQVTGPTPLTPIQHWFFEQDLADAHHFNQAFMLEPANPVDAAQLEQALHRLIEHHDGLRVRFDRSDDGWRQEIVPHADDTVLEVHDLSTVPHDQRARFMEEHAERLQASLDLRKGPIVRAALFPSGEGRDHLFLVIHHLAVDAVSWRVLLEDLEQILAQLGRGAPVGLPPKTTSLQAWARRLQEFARSEDVGQAVRHWIELPWDRVAPLPVDQPGGPGTLASVDTVDVGLTRDQTRMLLQEVPRVLGAQVHEALISALAGSLAEWTGGSSILLDVEGHGREDVLEGMDLSRTVGWFTTISPVVLVVDPATDPAANLRSVRAQLRSVPGRGIAYGVARYLVDGSSAAAALRELPRAQIAFNYLGQVDRTVGAVSAFKRSGVPVGRSRSSRNRRAHLLEINGGVVGDQLRMSIAFDRQVHREETIGRLGQRFTERLCQVVEACVGRNADRLDESASDFGWSQDDVDDILDELS